MTPDSAMRVLFVTRKWRPAVGGMETYCHELTSELAGHVELTVRALPGRPNGLAPSGLAILGFGLRIFAYLCLRARSFDVIHVADMASWPLALAGRLCSQRTLVVLSANGTDVAFRRRPGFLPFLYGAYLRAGSRLLPKVRVIANSRATAELCAEAGFGKSVVINLGTRGAGGVVNDPAAVENYVLYVGRLTRRKGCGWFVREVLPRLPDDIVLRIAGTVWDGSERPALEAGRVEFLGPVFGEDLARLRRHAIAVVMPNQRLHEGDFVEGFGLAALETAADGGIVCASHLDGLVDAVRDGETGFLLPSGEAEAWIRTIETLKRWSSTERTAFVERARKIVLADYSWARVAAKTVGVYRGDNAATREGGR